MPHIQVRDVPDDTHRRLTQKAELAGQSLQQFLSARLTELAGRPSMDEIVARIEARQSFSIPYDDIVEAISTARSERTTRARC